MSQQEDPVPTPRYRAVVAAAAEIAAQLQQSYVGVEHLFLAILRDRAAVPTQVLATFCDLDSIDDRLRELMASYGYRAEAPAGAVWVSRTELPDLLRVLPECVDLPARLAFNFAGDRAWIAVTAPGDGTAAVAAACALLSGP
ncbi:MAG: Clp protease N-terminal domain-containing protein [Streptosporangiaceae bacterium]